MRIQVASGPIELALGHDSLKILYLSLQTIGVVGDLLAHSRWSGTLAVGATKHWHFR